MKTGDLFPIAEERVRFNREYKVQATSEYRPPLKGEWFLSGAIVEGYQAFTDMNHAYQIARLVRIETRTITTIHLVEEI